MNKVKCEFTDQELEDIWSGLTCWQDKLNKKQNPRTAKAIKALILKVRKLLGHKNL